MRNVFFIFGATGDLASRKLFPALFKLFKKGYSFDVLGTGRRFKFEKEFKASLVGYDDDFLSHVRFVNMDFSDYDSDSMTSVLSDFGDDSINVMYYLSLSPEFYSDAISAIKDINSSCRHIEKKSVIVEKPFGYDLKSAEKYDSVIKGIFSEDEIFRVDHYLGKEFVQNILLFRFFNDIIQGIWNKQFIDHIQIIIDESLGVDKRISLYEKLGSLKDIVQNHMLQVVSLLTMGEPVSFDSKDISYEKLKVLRSVRPVRDAVFGRYKSLDNPKVHTMAAMKFYVDNFNFSDVPIYVRTGKKFPEKKSIIYIKFRDFKGSFARASGSKENALMIEIQPNMKIDFVLNVKDPSSQFQTREARLNYDHEKTFGINTPEAYEQILERVIKSDKSIFPSIDEILESWRIIDPISENFDAFGFEVYEDNTVPKILSEFIEKDNRKWIV